MVNPADRRALFPAHAAMSEVDSEYDRILLSSIPVFWYIHSEEVSVNSQISSFVNIFVGTHDPLEISPIPILLTAEKFLNVGHLKMFEGCTLKVKKGKDVTLRGGRGGGERKRASLSLLPQVRDLI
jgi:hypothetical protein